MFDKYVQNVLDFKKQNCTDLIDCSELNSIESLCTLLNALVTEENGCISADSENFAKMIEFWFIFCLIWSVCASVDEESRKKMDNHIREVEGMSRLNIRLRLVEYCCLV